MPLPAPHPGGLLTQWTPQPVAIVVVVALALGYVWGVRRLDRRWPVARSAVFAAGLVVLTWTTCGFFGVYGRALYWAWLSQTLLIWLLIPLVLLWGHPVQLARALSPRVDRVLASRPVRAVANPVVGPALVPLLSFAVFFGPVGGWVLAAPVFGWILQLALLLVGAVTMLPLVGLDGEPGSLAVGLSLAIGSFELVIDALPGIVMRLETHAVSGFLTHRPSYGWLPSGLNDQHLAGNILWTFAELIDVPFLWLVFRQWLRADARDAARVDAVLEAERTARRALTPVDAGGPDPGDDRDVPWWLSDPAMQERLRRNG